MKRTSILFGLVLIFVCLLGSPSLADWVNLSGAQNAPNIAEIYIFDDHIKVVFEIYIRDIITLDRLLPDEYFEGTGIERPPLGERLRQFSNQDLQIITGDGRKLLAKLELIEPRFRRERGSPYPWKINPYTRQPIPGPPEDKRVLYAELTYPLQTKPEELTFIPPLDDEGYSKMTIGFMTYHKGVPLADFKYLAESSKLTLDWDDPWYSLFENKSLKRWQVGGVMSFVYIEPYEVRHEILARVKDLAAWIDLDLRGDEFIEADENEPLKARVGEFFLNRDQVMIDGQRLRPILDRTSFVKYSTVASVFVEQPERLPINTAMVGVIITYLTEGMPQEVSNTWDLWSDRIQKVTTDTIDPVGGFPSFVEPSDNVYTWKNYLKNYTIPTVDQVSVAESLQGMRLPLGTILCCIFFLIFGFQIWKRKKNGQSLGIHAGAAILLLIGAIILYPHLGVMTRGPGSLASKVTNEEGKAILHSLLKNVYRAFDFRDEADVYDKLSISASGDLLAELYLQNRRSFQVQQAGGAQAKVVNIEVLEVEVAGNPDRSGTLDLRSRWQALGSVGHWGHIHNRVNQYEAIVTVETVEGAWKIIKLDLLEETRLDPAAQQQTTGETGVS